MREVIEPITVWRLKMLDGTWRSIPGDQRAGGSQARSIRLAHGRGFSVQATSFPGPYGNGQTRFTLELCQN